MEFWGVTAYGEPAAPTLQAAVGCDVVILHFGAAMRLKKQAARR